MEVTLSYQYGSPAGVEVGRPRCWGNPAEYNPDLRECRGCTFQASCRDNVVRLRNYGAPAYAPAPVPSPYQPIVPPGYVPAYPTAPPPARPTAAAVPVQTVQAANAPPAAPLVARPDALYPAPQQYGYGWLHDPMYQAMSACPPPIRPQLPGENFWERVMKNMFLAAGESFFMHGFLAMRQLVLPPDPRQVAEGTPPVQIPPTS